MATGRADEAVRPSQPFQVVEAVRISREPSLKLPKGPSTPSRSYCRIQPLQFYAGIGGGEVPIGFDMFLVPTFLPGDDLLDQGQLVGDTPIETLTRQHTEFGFSHVQPTAVLWCVVPLEPLDEPACLGGGKGFVE